VNKKKKEEENGRLRFLREVLRRGKGNIENASEYGGQEFGKMQKSYEMRGKMMRTKLRK